MLRYLVLVAAICVSRTVSTDTAYRLNTPIRPATYEIWIKPYFNTNNSNAFTFDGEVTIEFIAQNVTNQIKLHSEDLEFAAENISLTTGGLMVPLNDVKPLEFVKNYTFVYINLYSDLNVGMVYSLKIEYKGQIRKDLQGFYRNYYFERGVKKWLGATQMEPTHARKVFPCFDEPEYKAIFTLSIDRPANFQESRANTKLSSSLNLNNGYVRETFYPTPVMSTYLVAFVISEFEAGHHTVNGSRELGILTRPEAKNQTDYAFTFAGRVVDALGAYFGIDYYSTDANLKLDHVALPDFKAGAMENWGLVTYRESHLLYTSIESTPYYKYRVAQIVAHETTHMWFGDLVTCHWWSNTWLNEGFANYFQDYITALIEPDVGSGEILVTGSVYAAYDADSSPKSVPITNNDVNSPAEISEHFGTITYQKAGSVIRMMHHLLGDAAFILGLNVYLNTNKFKVGYPELLYAALQEGATSDNSLDAYPGATVASVMGSWISQAGHPVLFVQVNHNTGAISLTQNRFYYNSSLSSNELYKIPITYTTGTLPNFNNTKPAFIMENRTHNFTIANLNGSWVIFNIQETGLYRVNYDDTTWDLIFNALKGDDRTKIHTLNRAKIVNDLFALYFSDAVSLKRLLNALEFMEHETEYSVWNAAIRGINKLRHFFVGSDALTAIDDYAKKLTGWALTHTGYDVASTEGTVEQRNRMQILDLACRVGHTECVNHAIQLYQEFRKNGKAITPSLRPVAYCYGLRNGDAGDYDALWARLKATNIANERNIIADALGCTTLQDKLRSYLVTMKDEDSPIRIQDLTVPLTSVLAVYDNVDLVLDELKNNFAVWSSIHTNMDGVLSTVASALRTSQQIVQFEQWLSVCTNCTAEAVKSARSSLLDVKNMTTWVSSHKATLLSDFSSYNNNHAIYTLPTVYLLVVTLAFLLISK